MQEALPEWTVNLSGAAERRRLVRLCARITGDTDAAEDLAQEALVEAFRHAGALRDAAVWRAWVSGVARNVCLRWSQRRARDAARFARLPDTLADEGGAALPAPGADAAFLERAEQEERRLLLARALAHLASPHYQVLEEVYLRERTPEEAAARLGVSPGTLAVRLFRAKGALRRVLETTLAGEAASLGIAPGGAPAWRETRLWCPYCGEHRLQGRFSREPGRASFGLRCPGCTPARGRLPVGAAFTSEQRTLDFHAVLGDVNTFRPALRRVQAWWGQHFRRSLERREGPCITCGRPTRLLFSPPAGTPSLAANQGGAYKRCAHCRHVYSIPPRAFALMRPEVQSFWQRHPRVRCLPDREVRVDGLASVLTEFEAVGEGARIAVAASREDLRVLWVRAA